MPRYFFHIDDGEDGRDVDGTDLPDIRAAKAEAASTLGAMLMDEGAAFFDRGELKVTVEDERGLTLFALEITSSGGRTVLALTRDACQRANGTGWR
ncbi:DUF6894 family protein [Phenylobacterium deserti]|uniref:DUF6894 domain-containing protein n=1 Tax=Phenylobacterium deserti TaxID=1914756 RepID=A0A328A8N4_9CAUL|nr:hypothetical protein [Phenylobacterium deserti]RAK50920.1 hypothetical protein DJ018_17290 [Phenylobacterium deserti]